MEENKVGKKSDKSKNTGKNKSSSATPIQIVLTILLVVAFFFFAKSSDKIKADFSKLMAWEVNKDEVLGAFNEIQSYFDSSKYAWAVSDSAITNESSNVSNVASDSTSSDLLESSEVENSFTGSGGDDIEIFQAVENASFAPFFVTGSFLNPVNSNNFTSYFGYRINPISGKFSFHTGLDIAVKEGTNISAAFGGTVRKTGEDNQAGKYIFLTHDNGFETFYCHCSEILAKTGTVIRQGETIAEVGSTGASTGPHLHFEIRKNNIRLNPLQLFEK